MTRAVRDLFLYNLHGQTYGDFKGKGGHRSSACGVSGMPTGKFWQKSKMKQQPLLPRRFV
jgi:hypothetical protein